MLPFFRLFLQNNKNTICENILSKTISSNEQIIYKDSSLMLINSLQSKGISTLYVNSLDEALYKSNSPNPVVIDYKEAIEHPLCQSVTLCQHEPYNINDIKSLDSLNSWWKQYKNRFTRINQTYQKSIESKGYSWNTFTYNRKSNMAIDNVLNELTVDLRYNLVPFNPLYYPNFNPDLVTCYMSENKYSLRQILQIEINKMDNPNYKGNILFDNGGIHLYFGNCNINQTGNDYPNYLNGYIYLNGPLDDYLIQWFSYLMHYIGDISGIEIGKITFHDTYNSTEIREPNKLFRY